MRKTFLGAAVALAIGSSSTQAASWILQPYADVPGAANTELRGINDSGVMVGNTESGGFIDDHGARSFYTGVAGSTLSAISNSGVLVGGGPTDGFIDDHGTITTVSVPGALQTFAGGISPNGRYVVGSYLLSDTESEGFILDRSTSTFTRILGPAGSSISILRGINDAGVAVGNGGPANQTFVYQLDTGISTYYASFDGVRHPRLRAINDAGEMGGWGIDAAGNIAAIVGTVTGGFSTLRPSSATMAAIYGLNDLGEAVGLTQDVDFVEHALIATPATSVPEPASWALMLAGLSAGAARWNLRRRKAAAAA
jgi:hypothetical protein